MKFRLQNIAFLVLALLVLACATKKDAAEWKEMDEFHMVMAETFHPYKDSANLEPARARAGELVAVAGKWADSKLPEKVNNDEMKGKLKQLKAESATLAQTVAAADDKAIADQLTKVHDLFHAIQEDWYNGTGHHDHGHQH
jgi:hypothetical protein